MATNYKLLKEKFVSDHTGSTVWDINKVSLVMPSSVLLWSALQSRQNFFNPYTPSACITDVLINCIVGLLATTIYSDALVLFNILLLLPTSIVLLSSSPRRRHAKSKPPSRNDVAPIDPLPVKPFVTAYRAAMMIITCASILAVDFPVFPRRFAKVETWGTSLMDLGVGSFVFTSGVVSVRTLLRDRLQQRSTTLSSRLRSSLRHSLPLLILGLIRVYSVKGLDYAEHVTEYGVHWNFFFTLGLLPPFVAIFQSAFSIIPSYALLSILLGIAYECILDFTHLKTYILEAPRTDILSQNREGVFSFLGYLAIFLAGQAAGMDALPRQKNGLQMKLDRDFLQYSTVAKLGKWGLIWSALYLISSQYNGLSLPVSRRLANLPYILWVAAFNCCQLAICCAIEVFLFPEIYRTSEPTMEKIRCREATSRVMHAFNRNGLVIFLLANLLTGLVNLTLPTLHMGHLEAMAVLIAYISILSGVALYLDAKDISIKL